VNLEQAKADQAKEQAGKVDATIKAIEKKMRSFDRKAKKCTKSGDAMWAAVHTGRVLGLLDARNIILETFKEQQP
jgi:hypothetical protein